MLNTLTAGDEAALEQCIEEMDAFVDALDRYSIQVLAFAMRVHLGSLLRSLAEQRGCTREEIRQFVVELEQEALGVGEE